MKNLIIILCLALALASCSTTEKFTVNVPRNASVISPSPNNETLGVAHNSGNVKIEYPSDAYLGYVLVQQEGSAVKIPMGIDFKKSKHTGAKIAFVSGIGLNAVAIPAIVIGGVLLASSGDDDSSTGPGLALLGGGGAAALSGLGLMMPARERMKQTAYDYNFKYSKYQNFDIPQLSHTLINPNPSRESKAKIEEQEPTARKKASSGKDVSVQTKANVSKSRTDYGKRIEGVYTGSGSLKLNGRSEEVYDEISIIIKRVDKNHVLVSVVEGGEEYFDTPLHYTIKNTSKGYQLTIETTPNAIITISKTGNLKFEHKNVYIEDQKYALLISAKKSDNHSSN